MVDRPNIPFSVSREVHWVGYRRRIRGDVDRDGGSPETQYRVGNGDEQREIDPSHCSRVGSQQQGLDVYG